MTQLILDYMDLVWWSEWVWAGEPDDRALPDTAWRRRLGVQRPISRAWFIAAQSRRYLGVG